VLHSVLAGVLTVFCFQSLQVEDGNRASIARGDLQTDDKGME
jgi:hypothetical protein